MSRLPRCVALAALPLTLAVLAAPPAAATPSGTSASTVAYHVRDAMAGSTARHADYRFVVGGVGTISHHAATTTAPASTEKLLTTVTLLEQVGPNFHYVTSVFGTAPLVGHRLEGDLVLKASGDPTLTRADLAQLADRVHRAGVHRVTGHVVVDDSRYDHATMAPGWKSSFVPTETGPVDAFTVDRNTWRSGRTFDADPSHANAELWRAALRKARVKVPTAVKVESTPLTLTPIATHNSGPLREIVAHTLTVSDNFYAEMMLREAGAQESGYGTRTTGIRAVKGEAASLGVHIGKVYDGSGLSYRDRESPATLTAWLQAAKRLTSYPTLYASLPVSCHTGTLEHRLCGKHLSGKVHAKTGTLTAINALAGWATTRHGRTMTFAILLSGERSSYRALEHLDAAVSAAVRSS